MSLHIDFTLTDQIRAATKGAVWDAVITKCKVEPRWMSNGDYEYLVFIDAATCPAITPTLEFTPPRRISRLRWYHDQTPKPGLKVKVILAFARRIFRSEPDGLSHTIPFGQRCYTVEGDWDVLICEPVTESTAVIDS